MPSLSFLIVEIYVFSFFPFILLAIVLLIIDVIKESTLGFVDILFLILFIFASTFIVALLLFSLDLIFYFSSFLWRKPIIDFTAFFFPPP